MIRNITEARKRHVERDPPGMWFDPSHTRGDNPSRYVSNSFKSYPWGGAWIESKEGTYSVVRIWDDGTIGYHTPGRRVTYDAAVRIKDNITYPKLEDLL